MCIYLIAGVITSVLHIGDISGEKKESMMEEGLAFADKKHKVDDIYVHVLLMRTDHF